MAQSVNRNGINATERVSDITYFALEAMLISATGRHVQLVMMHSGELSSFKKLQLVDTTYYAHCSVMVTR